MGSTRSRVGITAIVVASVAVVVTGFVLVTAPPTQPAHTAGTAPASSAPTSATPTSTPLTPTTPASTEPLEVLFAQDSVGYGANSTTEARSFRPLVVAALEKQAPVTELTYGFPGYTVARTAELIPSVPTTLDVAVVELGTNDARVGRTVAEFTADYTALLDRLETASPDAALVCVGTLALYAVSAEFDGVIQSQCEQRGGLFVSIVDISANPADLAQEGSPTWYVDVAGDSVHPNDAGHAIIAQRIVAAIDGD